MWQKLKDILDGDLFETEKGIIYRRDRYEPWSKTISVQTLNKGSKNRELGLSNDTLVRSFDLDFLVLCVTDKLHENDAYLRGLKDATYLAAKIVKAELVKSYPHLGINSPERLSRLIIDTCLSD